MNFLILHGSYGSKNGNWFPWLKLELEHLGHKVFLLQFPVGKKQSLETWTKTVDTCGVVFDENLIIVAHSIGPAFALALLEKRKCSACFFVSGFLALLGNKEYDEVNKTFVTRKFDWLKIKNNCKRFYLYHGDNDPYVSLDIAKEFSGKIGVKTNIIKKGGHLNEEFGYTKFPKLLDDITTEVKK